MGWLFLNEKLRREAPAQFFTRMFTHTSGKQHAEVLDAAAVRGTICAAIRNTDAETGNTYLFCAVVRLRNNDAEGFGYKSMDTGMGPIEVDCSDRIMRQLPASEDIPAPGNAADWRACVTAAKAGPNECRQEARQTIPRRPHPAPRAGPFQ
jgi:hypothetical protein